MLGDFPLVAFVATCNSARAKLFYRDVLGLTLVREEPWALVFDANGTILRVSIVRDLVPAPFTVLGWQVPDVASMVQSLESAGVFAERFPGIEHDAQGIWTSPGGARILWFKDPDGNIISLTQV